MLWKKKAKSKTNKINEVEKWILIRTDEYHITHDFFDTYKSANKEMHRQFKKLTPKKWDENSKQMSKISAHGANLYQNRKDFFIWSIVKVL